MFRDLICSYSVLPHDGKWHVFVDDDTQPTVSFLTKDEAVAWCRSGLHHPVPQSADETHDR